MLAQDKVKKIGVSIISYNNPEDVQKCLESIDKIKSKIKFQALIRDHSTSHIEKQKISKIVKRYKFATYFDPIANSGFVGHNYSVAELVSSGCTHILLLNPDCVIEQSDFFDLLLEESVAHKDNCLIQPVIKDFDGSVGNVGNVPHYLGMGGQRNPSDIQYNNTISIGIVSGACLFFSIKVLKELKYLFSDLYFMYHEDTDLSLRAKTYGITTILSTQVEIKHDHVFGKSRFKFFYLDRNKLIFQYSYYRWWELLLLVPAIILGEIVSFVFSVVNGWWNLKIDVYMDLWKKKSEIQSEKNHIQSLLNTHGRKKLYDTLEPYVSTKDFATSALLKLGMGIVNALFFLNWTIFRFLTFFVK